VTYVIWEVMERMYHVSAATESAAASMARWKRKGVRKFSMAEGRS